MRKRKTRNKFYDERQAIERGKAFRNGYISMFATMLFCYLEKDCFRWNLLDDFSMLNFCTWVPLSVVSVTLILRNAYDGINEGYNVFGVWCMGLTGVFMLFVVADSVATGNFTVYHNSGFIFLGSGMIIIAAVYIVKRSIDRKREKKEEQSEKTLDNNSLPQ